MMTRADPGLQSLAAAVTARARAVAGAVQRMDGLSASGTGELITPSAADRRALALRLLHVAGNPAADLLLRSVAEGPVGTAVLANLLGQDRVALWETLADLVQANLLEHDPERATVSATPAGRALVELVDRLADGGEQS